MFAKRKARKERLLTGIVALLVVGFSGSLYIALRADKPGYRDNDIPAVLPGTAHRASAPLTESDLAALWGESDPTKPTIGDTAPYARTTDPDNRPKFIVRGIVYSTARSSVAFIEVAKSLKLYREGQFADGWRIAKIERDKVTVCKENATYCVPISMASYAARPWIPDSRDAPSERLQTMAMQAPTSISRKNRQPEKTFASSRAVTTGSSLSTGLRPLTGTGADATVAVPQDLVEQARTDPKSLLGDVKVGFSTDSGGRVNGVRLNKVPSGSLAARYGFAAGDRIVAVNGQPLTSYAQASRLHARYRNDTSATITIERNGVSKNVVYYTR